MNLVFKHSTKRKGETDLIVSNDAVNSILETHVRSTPNSNKKNEICCDVINMTGMMQENRAEAKHAVSIPKVEWIIPNNIKFLLYQIKNNWRAGFKENLHSLRPEQPGRRPDSRRSRRGRVGRPTVTAGPGRDVVPIAESRWYHTGVCLDSNWTRY